MQFLCRPAALAFAAMRLHRSRHAARRLRRRGLLRARLQRAGAGRVAALDADTVVFDLEDAVVPEAKAAARERLGAIFAGRQPGGPELVVRVNAASTDWGADDLAAACQWEPDGVLLPKVDTPRDLLEAGDVLDDGLAPDTVRLWAMIETPKSLLNIGAIAELGGDPASRLACLVAGTNDLVRETGIADDRRYLMPWLMQMVLAARAGGLAVLDGVRNDFSDTAAFAAESAGCRHGLRRQDGHPPVPDCRSGQRRVFAVGDSTCRGPRHR